MKIEAGAVIKAPGMKLRVTKVNGRNATCEYWDSITGEWKPRGCAENMIRLREGIESGKYEIEMN